MNFWRGSDRRGTGSNSGFEPNHRTTLNTPSCVCEEALMRLNRDMLTARPADHGARAHFQELVLTTIPSRSLEANGWYLTHVDPAPGHYSTWLGFGARPSGRHAKSLGRKWASLESELHGGAWGAGPGRHSAVCRSRRPPRQ